MKVQVYSILKDHFEKEFELTQSPHNTEELRNMLASIRPASKIILNSCRFAVNDMFVEGDFKLQSNDTIAVLPPSSGG